jgi:hypothetical protein
MAKQIKQIKQMNLTPYRRAYRLELEYHIVLPLQFGHPKTGI